MTRPGSAKEIKSLERFAELMDSVEVIRKMKEIIG